MSKIAAFKKVSDAPLGTVGAYNMTTSTITLNVGACTYTFRLNSEQQINAGASPGTTPIVSSGKSSAALSSPGIFFLAALIALLLAAPMRI